MKILKRVLLILAILLLLVSAIGLLLSRQIHVERSVEIKQKPEIVFAYVNNMKNWNTWSPWFDLDSAAEYSYEGPVSGVGATMNWKSSKKDVGSGSMTFTEVVPNESIKEDLNFMENGTAKAGFLFAPVEGGVKVTWTMDVDAGYNPLMRILGKFMDGMVGKDFEKGLGKLKAVTESLPETTHSEMRVEEIQIPHQFYLAVHDTATINTISMKLGKGFGTIGAAMKKQGLKMAGAPFAFYFTVSAMNFDFNSAVAVDRQGKDDGVVKAGEIKAGNGLRVRFFGSYEKTALAHQAIHDYAASKNKNITGAPWEVYITDPGMEKDTTKWETDVYYPVE